MLKEWLPLLPYVVKVSLSWKRPAITLSILCLSHRKYPKVTYRSQREKEVWESIMPRLNDQDNPEGAKAHRTSNACLVLHRTSKSFGVRTVKTELCQLICDSHHGFSSVYRNLPGRNSNKLKLFKTYSINNVMFQRISLHVAKWKSDNYIENLGSVFFLV